MTTERSTTDFAILTRDFYRTFLEEPQALGKDAGRLLRSWFLLIRWALKCVWLTLRFVWRTTALVVRLLTPVPRGVEHRFQKRSTGLPIPAMEMSIIVFGTIALASYLW